MSTQDHEGARRALRRHQDALLSLPQVHGVGIGTAADHGGPDEPCLVIWATTELDAASVPRVLDGVRVYVVRGDPPRFH